MATAVGLFAPVVFGAVAVNPHTWLGRVTDPSGLAFDTNKVATIRAYSADGALLSSATTFFRSDSRRNYSIAVPLADADTENTAQVGDVLVLSVTDNTGKVWAGVVVDPGRTDGTLVGEPGGVHEVDIRLGEDKDGDGIDDALRARLKSQWENSDVWEADTEFDPNDDHDGDGMSTLDEALAGTNPFNEDNVLRITAFDPDFSGEPDAMHAISFPGVGGRAYSLLSAETLDGEWKETEFCGSRTDAAPKSVLALPTTVRGSNQTIYLLPVEGDARFFKVKLQ